MNTAQLINQDSGDYEYYSPPLIIAVAGEVMGGIDLDPASSDYANSFIRASAYFTVADDGLVQSWHGRIWLNHPFSRAGNRLWIDKLVHEYKCGHVTQACCITYAATSERWFQPLLAYPQCFLCPRTNYYLPNGEIKRGVTKGSVVTYLGENIAEFVRKFTRFGVCKIAVTT